ncbi:MAG: hypothetical protein JWN86_4547, partial [Planctomycetota bacterium]|nr:hypothetical protein [Planctomycetota bacterium]
MKTPILALMAAALLVAAAPAQAPKDKPATSPPKPARVGFAEGRTGEIPAGAAELITPETQRAIESGLQWLAKQ